MLASRQRRVVPLPSKGGDKWPRAL
jgi:hypothetical protein